MYTEIAVLSFAFFPDIGSVQVAENAGRENPIAKFVKSGYDIDVKV